MTVVSDDDIGSGKQREAVRRRFDVDVPVDQAWDSLVDIETWPAWAPHIRRVVVSPSGPMGPSSSGAFRLRGGLRATFRMTVWEPPRRWVWVGRSGGLTIHYDHRFEASANGTTSLEWIVSLSGIGSRIAGRPFAFAYGRNVDRAIPLLQAKLQRPSTRDREDANDAGGA